MDSEEQKREMEHHFASNEVSAYLLEMLRDRQEEFLAKVDADLKALENRVHGLEERITQGKSAEVKYNIAVLDMNALKETVTPNGENIPENMDGPDNVEEVENG